jgi:hypothetical protein
MKGKFSSGIIPGLQHYFIMSNIFFEFEEVVFVLGIVAGFIKIFTGKFGYRLNGIPKRLDSGTTPCQVLAIMLLSPFYSLVVSSKL